MSPTSWAFAGFQLDPIRRRLERGGELVPVTGRVLDLLLALVERRHTVVSKDELLAIVWRDAIVEENNLTVAMSALRKALGEQPGDHRFVVTVPGRGYRFVAAITAAPSVPDREPAGPRLPVPFTSFVGRQRELEQVRTLVGERRLVTLTGAGGCGKTRLAIESARAIAGQSSGAWFVELAALSDPALIAQAAARAFALRDDAGANPVDAVIRCVADQRALLVLDNCEHVIEACARLAASLLDATPHLRILVTSREPLGLPGETVFRVPSLSAPPVDDQLPIDRALGFDAVSLFVDRASAAQPGFVLTTANVDAVVRVCARLDGIPLALELAAARSGAVSVERMAVLLDDQFSALAAGGRTALPRHRTLRASIDWSYDLLTEHEQRLLRQLSVFFGGWTLEAAEAVASVNGGSIIDLLAALVAKSLVVADHRPGGGTRYRLLETVRQYARERLTDSGEEDDLRARHFRFFLELAEKGELELLRADARQWLERLSAEQDNVRAALDWSLGRDATGTLGLAGAFSRFWSMRGYLREGAERLERALSRSEGGRSMARAKALHGAASLAFFRGELDTMAHHAAESLAIVRPAGDAYYTAYALLLLAMADLYQRGDGVRAAEQLNESLEQARRAGEPLLIALVLVNLGFPAVLHGDLDRARELLGEGLSIARASGNAWIIAGALLNTGLLRLAEGNPGEAEALCRESLAIRHQIGDRWGMLQSLQALAQVALASGDAERSAFLLGATGKIARLIGAAVPAFVRAAHERTEAQTRAALGEEAFTNACSDGDALALDAIAAAVGCNLNVS